MASVSLTELLKWLLNLDAEAPEVMHEMLQAPDSTQIWRQLRPSETKFALDMEFE
jgi:hypothetical protein